MSDDMQNLGVARADVTASSCGGAPFLIVFGVTLGLAGALAFVLTTPVAALVFFLTDPDVLGPTLGFLALGLIFAPLWSVIFAALYKRMS